MSEYQSTEETAGIEETAVDDDQESSAPVAASDSQDDWNDD